MTSLTVLGFGGWGPVILVVIALAFIVLVRAVKRSSDMKAAMREREIREKNLANLAMELGKTAQEDEKDSPQS